MRSTLTLLAVLLAVGSTADKPTRFDLDSTHSTYPFVTRLKGEFSVQRDSLVIDVAAGSVGSQIPPDVGDDGIAEEISISFGLGSPDSGSWSFDHQTAEQLVAPSLHPGERKEVPALHFVIPGMDTVPLADRWLAAEVRVRQHLPGVEAGFLNSYACAEDNLLGPTVSSRDRSKRMRSNYSHIC
jgi:hypothetical protein